MVHHTPSQDYYSHTVSNTTYNTHILTLLTGHRALVLGPIGCGAFMNPRDQVAQAFHELLHPDGEFGRCFDLVVFSVIKDPFNVYTFEQVFGTKVSLDSIL